MPDDYRVLTIFKKWKELTGDSFSDFMKIDFSLIIRYLEYDRIEKKLTAAKIERESKNANPGQ